MLSTEIFPGTGYRLSSAQLLGLGRIVDLGQVVVRCGGAAAAADVANSKGSKDVIDRIMTMFVFSDRRLRPFVLLIV